MTTVIGIIIALLLLAAAFAVVLWPEPSPNKWVDPEEEARAKLRSDLRSALRREADQMALPEKFNLGLLAEFRRLSDLMDCNEITWGHAYTSGAAWIRERSPLKCTTENGGDR